MSTYLLGLITIPALLFVGWLAIGTVQWWRWWAIHDDGRFHGGKGYQHVADFYSAESGEWYPRGQHTHWWPPDTPWWLIRLAEPARVWICHHSADHRPATPKAKEAK